MKRFKRAGVALLCTVMAITLILPLGVRAEDGSAGRQAAKVLSQIRLSVGDGQETPVFKAGETAELKIKVANKGNLDAQNVSIAPVVENTDDWPFDMEKLNYEQELGTIKAGKDMEAAWGSGDDKLKVREDVTGKSYKLVFRLTYDDGENQGCTDKYVFVKTVAKENPSDSGDNGGQTADPQPPQTDTPGNGGNGGENYSDGDLGGGAVYNSDSMEAGGGSGGSGDGSVPRVIVTGFDTEPGDVKAGTNFKLVVHLKNTSKRTAVSNMLFDFQAPAAGTDAAAEAPAFLPVSGSSTVYLENIAAGGTKDISIELNARADLVQKPYSISLGMKYEDGNAVQYEGSSSLAIPVKQEARFEFSQIQASPDTVAVGEESNITCSLYNLGRVKMYNVKVRFEGDAIEGQEQFIGNLDSGSTGTIDGIVTAVEESYEESNCKLVLTYEDDAGNVSTVEQEFTMTVNAVEEIMDMGMSDMTEEEPGSPVPGILLAAAAVIVIGIILAAVLIKNRKKKKLAAEEEELMDEVERLTEDEHQQP